MKVKFTVFFWAPQLLKHTPLLLNQPISPIIYFEQKFQAPRLFSPLLVFRTQEYLFFPLLVPNIMQSFRTRGFLETEWTDRQTDRWTNWQEWVHRSHLRRGTNKLANFQTQIRNNVMHVHYCQSWFNQKNMFHRSFQNYTPPIM